MTGTTNELTGDVEGAARGALVLGARNLGGAIVERLLADGWRTAAVSRRQESLRGVRERGAVAITADASHPEELDAAIARARSELGALDLIVNAVSSVTGVSELPAPGPFGGGPVADATLEGFRGYGLAIAEQAFVAISCGTRALRDGGGGTFVQVTGGSSRRARPGLAAWAAGQFATRAVVQAAAQELRKEGVHVALLAVDATIESPKTDPVTADQPRDALASMEAVAAAVAFLAEQGTRGMTHDLALTPALDRWVP